MAIFCNPSRDVRPVGTASFRHFVMEEMIMNDVITRHSEDYVNLCIQGIGYLNRVREVRPRRGNPFVSCTIAALHGSLDAVKKTLFECIVVGGEAIEVVRHFSSAAESQRVLIGFRLGDPWVDTYTFGPESARAGQFGAIIKAKLVYVSWVRVDGEKVWSRVDSKDAKMN